MNKNTLLMLSSLAACGTLLAAAPVKRKVVLEVQFDPSTPGIEQMLEPVFKFAKAYETHPFVFQKTKKAGLREPAYEVLAPTGGVVYSGGAVTDAQEAVVNQLTDMPVPGALCLGVVISKFKADRKKLEWLGSPMEGFALKKYRDAVRSGKPEFADEAKAILEAIEKRRKGLAEEIADALEDDRPAALRDMRLYVATWPSEKKKYAAKIAELSADPAVKAAADRLQKAIRKK